MSFGDNRPNKDPTIGGNHDGRTPNEQRFIDFPNNPDMYGHIDPYQVPNYHGGNNDAYPQYNGGPPLNNFAPPGQMPTGFDPNSPMHGVDGRGSLVMRGNDHKVPQRGPPIKGDVDIMVANGVIQPPPAPPGNYGYGYDDDVDPGFSMGGLRRPGDRGPGFGQNGMGGPPGFGEHPGMGGPPGFGGSRRKGGPPGFGGGFM